MPKNIDTQANRYPDQVRQVESILSREQQYEEAKDYIDDAAREIVDPLLDLVNASQIEEAVDDDRCTDDFPLRWRVGQCVELRIRFKGGSMSVTGRVIHVPARLAVKDQLCIGDASLPYDAMVRRESVGLGFVFESTAYNGERS